MAKSITSAPKYVFLATGTDYHSALAASSAAGSLGTTGTATVVLNEGNKLTSSVRSYLNSIDPNETMVITVGDSAKYALTHTYFSNWPSDSSYYPITGSGHDGTAVALAKFWWGSRTRRTTTATFPRRPRRPCRAPVPWRPPRRAGRGSRRRSLPSRTSAR